MCNMMQCNVYYAEDFGRGYLLVLARVDRVVAVLGPLDREDGVEAAGLEQQPERARERRVDRRLAHEPERRRVREVVRVHLGTTMQFVSRQESAPSSQLQPPLGARTRTIGK